MLNGDRVMDRTNGMIGEVVEFHDSRALVNWIGDGYFPERREDLGTSFAELDDLVVI